MSTISVFDLAHEAGVAIFEDAFVDCQVNDLALFASLVLEEAAKMLDFAADGLDGTGEADAVALVLDCADMVRALKPVQP